MLVASYQSDKFPAIAPDERAPLPAVVEVLLVVEHEADVVLAAHQDHRRVRAEFTNLRDCESSYHGILVLLDA